MCKLNFLQQFSCRIPNTEGLPTVQDCHDLLELYNAISIETMVDIYSSLLRERRLILTGTRLAQISRCALAIMALIYPMHWWDDFYAFCTLKRFCRQHIFIPVLPKHLTSYLVAPMPYIIGVHSAVLEVKEPPSTAISSISGHFSKAGKSTTSASVSSSMSSPAH